MKLMPRKNKVIVKQRSPQLTTTSGIILSSQDTVRHGEGVVIRAGTGALENGHTFDLDVKKDDKIVFEKHAGIEVEVEDKKYLIVDIRDILAII